MLVSNVIEMNTLNHKGSTWNNLNMPFIRSEKLLKTDLIYAISTLLSMNIEKID